MILETRHFGLGLVLLAMTGVAACQPAVPDSGAGVGFGDYSQYQQQREAQLAGRSAGGLPQVTALEPGALPPAPSVTASAIGQSGDSAAAIAADASAAIAAAEANSGVPPLEASPSNPAPVAVNAMGISEENDFEAVGEQRTIASDKALMEANRAAYTQVQPTALPTRTDTGPNIVAYALQTSHAVGQSQYRRTSLGSGEARYQRACAGYPSPDLAQADFLKNGGPERDRMGVDPDGDGYACTWDPRPFRKAAGG